MDAHDDTTRKSLGKTLSKTIYAQLIEIVKLDTCIEEKEEAIQELFNFDPNVTRPGKYMSYTPKQGVYTQRYRAKKKAQLLATTVTEVTEVHPLASLS
jgi:hypothetical protein